MIVIIKQRGIAAFLLTALVATSCGESTGSDRLTVLATTSILGELTERLVGDLADVETLMPAAADPHSFQPSARQAASLRDADLIIANGLDLEAALADVLDSARSDGVLVVEVGSRIEPRTFEGSTALDPHFWLDPEFMARAAKVITIAVRDLAPDHEHGGLLETLTAVQTELAVLDEDLANRLSAVTNRKLVTSHDSLGYLAARYDFEVVGTVFPGGSSLASPSPRDISELIATMDAEGVSAVFSDAAEPDSLARLIAEESNRSVEVVELYIGTLGPAEAGADSYAGMMQLNADLIAGALS